MEIASLFISIGGNLSSRQLVGRKILTCFSAGTRTGNTFLLDSITDNRYDTGREEIVIGGFMYEVALRR